MAKTKTYRAYYSVIVNAADERGAMIQGFNRLAAFYGEPEDEDEDEKDEEEGDQEEYRDGGDNEEEHEQPSNGGGVAFVRADVIDEA